MGNSCSCIRLRKRAGFSGTGNVLGSGSQSEESVTVKDGNKVREHLERSGEGEGSDRSGIREAAARAAELRAARNGKRKGFPDKLERQLQAQRRATQSELLQQISRENVQARNADQATVARRWQ